MKSLLRNRSFVKYVSCQEVEWTDSANCDNYYNTRSLISYTSLTSTVDVAGFMCTTKCKSVQVRERVLEVRRSDQGNTEVSVSNTPVLPCTCYLLIFWL